MKFIGAHVSTEGGVDKAPLNAGAIGARAFALFVKPQRQWIAPPLKQETVDAFAENLKKSGIFPENVLPHASYLINMANPDNEARSKAVDSLVGELERCAALGLPGLNIHPGSYLKTGTREEALERIADSINQAHSRVAGVSVILENTAGQGSYLGSTFEELAAIISSVNDQSRVGICIDTAHLHGAGYDLTTDCGYGKITETLANIPFFGKLRGLHLNDTNVELGSHKDRHAPIGDGLLGWSVFKRIVSDEIFENIPLVLETPEPERWAEEIRRLYEL